MNAIVVASALVGKHGIDRHEAVIIVTDALSMRPPLPRHVDEASAFRGGGRAPEGDGLDRAYCSRGDVHLTRMDERRQSAKRR